MYVKVHDINIFYLEHGEGKPLIILHGYLLDSTSYAHLNELLTKNKVYILDLPGFGKSDKVALGVKEYASLLEGFIEKLKICNPTIVGHSFGGRIAIEYGSIHPENKLILISTPGIKETSFLSKIKIALYHHFHISFESEDYKNSDYIQREIMKKAINYPIEDKLGYCLGEVLIMHGKKDKVVPIRIAKKMNKQMLYSALIKLDCGHHPLLEIPYQSSLIMEAFINHD